jgi:predicted dinucleotide-binding enzyme
VFVANSRSPETLSELATETGATAATPEDAVRGADLVIVALPTGAVSSLRRELFDTRAPGAPIIDTSNYYPQQRHERIEEIENGMTEARWVERQVGPPVVKVFNSINWLHLLELGKPARNEGRIALPVAADDADAKQLVMDLVDQLGFDPVDAGGLDDSWRQQPGKPAYTADLDADELRDALAAASPERPPGLRAA